VLAPLRRLIPPVGGTVDISPVVALIILEVVRRILVSVLVGL
ncbi:MAG: YggT family protein, partial [Anaerolineae bacterium]|nr:YggT family protein [Anaerolineae bacterium]